MTGKAMKFLHWTMTGGRVDSLSIVDPETVMRGNDYGLVNATPSQNQVRHWLSVLQRTQLYGHPALPDRYDLKITYDESRREYRLWAYINNWSGRASFLAGILFGKSRQWDRVQRRLRKRKRSKTV